MPPKTRSTSTSQPAGNKRGKKAGTSKKSIAVKREDSVVEGANHFPFLKLPAELRNKIYSYVLVQQPGARCFRCDSWHKVKMNGRRCGHVTVIRRVANAPTAHKISSILQVNQQIRREAVPMYYGFNGFVFHVSNMHLCAFMSWLGMLKDHAKHLKHITFYLEGDGGWPNMTGYAITEAQHLSRSCIVKQQGNVAMKGAFNEQLAMVKHLRSLGLKWSDVQSTMLRMTEVVSSVGPPPEDYEWAEWGNDDIDSDYMTSDGEGFDGDGEEKPDDVKTACAQ